MLKLLLEENAVTKKEIKYFNIAKSVSELSDHKYKLGAIVIYKHRIISSGYNSSTNTDALQAKLDKNKYKCDCVGKLHAESAALIYFIKRHISLSGAEIYVYRRKADGTIGMARPCSSCMELIKQCGIRKVHYTTDDGYAVELITENSDKAIYA